MATSVALCVYKCLVNFELYKREIGISVTPAHEQVAVALVATIAAVVGAEKPLPSAAVVSADDVVYK